MSHLSVSGLHKSFGATHVLRGVDLDVPAGTLTAVLGPSGCGKTTLLRVIAGFERPQQGEVSLGGNQVVGAGVHVPSERRRVAVVPQEGTLFPHLDVADNVGFGLARRDPRRRGRVQDMLDLVGLAGLDSRRPSELSGGQQQRVALARALAPEPEVVLLDEPFSALDAGLRASVREDVRAALRKVGATAVLVTHDQEEALSIADSVAVMRDGVVVQHGSPQQVYLRPADLQVARFVGEAILLDATLAGDRAHTLLGDLEVRAGCTTVDPASTAHGTAGPGLAMIRPEQVHLGAPGTGVRAYVDRAVFHGHDATVHLDVRTANGSLPIICRIQGDLPKAGEVSVRVRGQVSFYPR